MALPKRKHSVSRKNTRRSTKQKELPQGVVCKNCGELRLSHRLCGLCGKQ